MTHRWLGTSDAAAWEAALPQARSAFGSLGFARAQERAAEVTVRLLVAEAGAARAACPYVVRSARDLPFAPSGTAALADVATPPFTGPYVTAPRELDDGALGRLEANLAEGLAEAGVVAEFAHIHPFAAERRLVADAEPDREIVWVDTALDDDALWRESYSKACRKNIKRAQRERVQVRVARDREDVARFHRIYLETMRRATALPAYFFDLEFFVAIFDELPHAARFALAERDGEVIAATLYLHDAEDVYSYLGGALPDDERVRPTNAVVHETIRWAREQGKRRLILGAGYRPDDGIMRFKASFSPQRATLRLARRVRRPDEYRELTRAWREHHGAQGDPAFFPAFRAPTGSQP